MVGDQTSAADIHTEDDRGQYTQRSVSMTQNKEDQWTEGQCLQTVTQNCQLYLHDVSELEHT
jgi:hypothetical protein